MSFPGGSEVKVSACSAGDPGSIPGLGKSPGEGNGNPLRYSCLENPMDGGAWWATAHGVAKSWTRLSDFTCPPRCNNPECLHITKYILSNKIGPQLRHTAIMRRQQTFWSFWRNTRQKRSKERKNLLLSLPLSIKIHYSDDQRGDFPGGPLAKTLHSQCRRSGSISS